MMQLAVSSIAWSVDQDEAVARLLQSHSIMQVELAPTKLWPELIKEDPSRVTDEQIKQVLSTWRDHGIKPVAMQSMLFLRPDLTIFDNAATRERTLQYLKQFILLSSRMGIKRMVFGSPKNRQKGDMDGVSVDAIAGDFFSAIGSFATENGVVFCIEPNAPQYACDYVTTAKEGAELVRAVGSRGFKLHLDAACMALAGDDPAGSIRDNRDILSHYHISSPMLEQVEERNDVNHASAADALRAIGYDQTISIEMRPGTDVENLHRIERAVQEARRLYSIS